MDQEDLLPPSRQTLPISEVPRVPGTPLDCLSVQLTPATAVFFTWGGFSFFCGPCVLFDSCWVLNGSLGVLPLEVLLAFISLS